MGPQLSQGLFDNFSLVFNSENNGDLAELDWGFKTHFEHLKQVFVALL